MFGRVSDDAALAHFAAAHFELRLDERDGGRALGEAGGERREDLRQRDERHVHGRQVEEGGELFGGKLAGVLPFDDDDARVLAQFPRQLIVTDVDSPYARRAVLQQAVCEAAGGRADVQARLTSHVEVERAERRFELQAAATDVARHLAFQANVERRVDHLAGLVGPLLGDEHLAGENQRLRPRPALGQPAFDDQLVESFLRHESNEYQRREHR